MKIFIRLLILTVMLKDIKTDVSKASLLKILPQGCKKLNYNIMQFSPGDKDKFGLKNVSQLYSTQNSTVFDYTNNQVVRKLFIENSLHLNKLALLLKLEGISEGEAGITSIKQNGCYYNTVEYKNSSFTNFKMVNVYLIEDKCTYDLFDFLGSKKKYLRHIQWQIDLMIKIAIFVRKIHRKNIVLRNLNLTTIRMKEIPKYSSSYPILTEFDEAATVGQAKPYIYEYSFFRPKNEFNGTNAFSFDIYSLGKIFYAISHWKTFSTTGTRFLYKCDNSPESKKPNFIYCDYLEEFIFEMINEDPSQRPSLDDVITRLREIRAIVNNRLYIIYDYLKKQIETGTTTDEHGNFIDMNANEIKSMEEAIQDYSYLYEVHVINSLDEINKLYPQSNNPYRKLFYEEHQETLEALKTAGY